jgi:hypothetical protein
LEKECFYCKQAGYLEFKHEKENCTKYRAVAPSENKFKVSYDTDSDEEDDQELDTIDEIVEGDFEFVFARSYCSVLCTVFFFMLEL